MGQPKVPSIPLPKSQHSQVPKLKKPSRAGSHQMNKEDYNDDRGDSRMPARMGDNDQYSAEQLSTF